MDPDDHIPDAALVHWLENYGDQAVGMAVGNPVIFAKMYYDGDAYGIEAEDLSEVAGSGWTRGGDQHLSRDAWRELFDLAGYREDDEPAPRPAAPLVLWRGATPEHRSHWSWTENRDVAVLYASSFLVQSEVGLVWRAVVEPGRLLARVGLGRYHEYIVDTAGLAIEPDGLWCRCGVDLDPFRGDDRASQIALDMHDVVDCPRG